MRVCVRESVCVCVCVREREKEKVITKNQVAFKTQMMFDLEFDAQLKPD